MLTAMMVLVWFEAVFLPWKVLFCQASLFLFYYSYRLRYGWVFSCWRKLISFECKELNALSRSFVIVMEWIWYFIIAQISDWCGRASFISSIKGSWGLNKWFIAIMKKNWRSIQLLLVICVSAAKLFIIFIHCLHLKQIDVDLKIPSFLCYNNVFIYIDLFFKIFPFFISNFCFIRFLFLICFNFDNFLITIDMFSSLYN